MRGRTGGRRRPGETTEVTTGGEEAGRTVGSGADLSSHTGTGMLLMMNISKLFGLRFNKN